MSKFIRLKKGLDIKLQGVADKVLIPTSMSNSYAVKPSDFNGVTPKLLVREGDSVKAGTPLFFDKFNPELIFVSPVSGVISAVERGEKRKILQVVITPSETQEYESFEVGELSKLSREQVVELIQKAGLWSLFIQRPYGIIPRDTAAPKAIFVSAFDSAPLAVDFDFITGGYETELLKGIEVLKKLTDKVCLGVSTDTQNKTISKINDIEVNTFSGPHPAGNVGIQIHHTNPMNKGEIAWTIDMQNIVLLGRLFISGKVDMTKIVAITGSEITKPRYQRIVSGADIETILKGNLKTSDNVRYISGNPLTGTQIAANGHISYYSNQLTVIPEGNKHEFLGWIAPRLNKFSTSRSYFSFLSSKDYTLDTNLNGGVRALVMTGEYEKVVPMDIYPVYLVKAILAEDIDKMENLGIYEIIEEDFALCEFVCSSKTPVQEIVRSGLNLMIKELS